MLTQDQIDVLKAPFPEEALRADTSRGFELTSIRAAYVIERLNDAFGPCGIGWRYTHSPFEDVPTDNGRLEVVTEVAFQCRPADLEGGCGRVSWAEGWQYGTEHAWSEPIFACGGKGLGRGGAPYTDARKSAVTDGLTKAASMIGVGHHVFKGLVLAPGGNGRSRPNNGGSQKDNATAFWILYNEQAKPLGVPMSKAKELADNGDWSEACDGLRALIKEARNQHTRGVELCFPRGSSRSRRSCAAQGETTMVQIRFWWPGYSPEDALDSFDLAVQATPFEVSRDGGRSWRLPQNGATLQKIHEWMVDHDRIIVDTKLVEERRNGQWEGQYVLTIDRNGKQGG